MDTPVALDDVESLVLLFPHGMTAIKQSTEESRRLFSSLATQALSSLETTGPTFLESNCFFLCGPVFAVSID